MKMIRVLQYEGDETFINQHIEKRFVRGSLSMSTWKGASITEVAIMTEKVEEKKEVSNQ